MSNRESFNHLVDAITEWELAAQQLPLADLGAVAATCQQSLAKSLDAINDLYLACGAAGLGFGPPKSKVGKRTVPFHAMLHAELRQHLDEHVPHDQADALVFSSPAGRPMRHSNFYRRAWPPAVAKAGLSGVHLLSRPGARFRCWYFPAGSGRAASAGSGGGRGSSPSAGAGPGCGRPPAPLSGSPLTISGLVSHLRWVESPWIEVRLLGGAIDAPWTDDDPDREFRIAVGVPLAQLLAEYRAACARHRDLMASLELDTPSRGVLGWRTEPVTLRWILFHLTEETARHNGPLDILGELADGHARTIIVADRPVRSPVKQAIRSRPPFRWLRGRALPGCQSCSVMKLIMSSGSVRKTTCSHVVR
jgi:hypothetical protein